MRLKTSFFNPTVYKKNLTRFAPVWGVYALCLVLGTFLLYNNGGVHKAFHFAGNIIGDLFDVMAYVNLLYALMVAQLLFGDLYNSRMCNMLHAFPLSRSSWFVTHILSGLTMAVVPHLLMALVMSPLLIGSLFEDAVLLAWYLFLFNNLAFVCFFGIAALAAMLVGNRFTMAAGYGLLNTFAGICYWVVDTLYTPLLYGVITPTQLMCNLTPNYHFTQPQYLKTSDSVWALQEKFGNSLGGASATYEVTGEWYRLWVLALIGIGCMVLALVLYRKRNLECAGDAVAFKPLVPVFKVLCTVFVAVAAQYLLTNMIYMEANYVVLVTGLIVGWILAHMLIQRSTRVFRLKNFRGLVILGAIFAASLGLTHFDVFGIDDYIPEAHKVQSVEFHTDYTSILEYDSPVDIERLIALQVDALENRVEEAGTYIRGYDGSLVRWMDSNAGVYYDEDEEEIGDCTFATQVRLTYYLTNGKEINRKYNVWVDSEGGDIAREYLNRWDVINNAIVEINGVEYPRLDIVLEDFSHFTVNHADKRDLPEICFDVDAAKDLIEAIQADCAEGNMAEHPYFHQGHFRYQDEYAEDGWAETYAMTLVFKGEKYSSYFEIFPDSMHTLRWLKNHGLLEWEPTEGTMRLW